MTSFLFYQLIRCKLLLPLPVVLVFVAAPALACDLHKGIDAYNKGNYAAALKIIRPLAEGKNSEAQYYLGRMYQKGQGVDKDLEQAEKWYRLAAEGGHAKAQYKIAFGYAFGVGGLDQNDAKAREWLQKSAENGYRKAQKMLARAYQHGKLGLTADPERADYWFAQAEKKKE